MSDIRDKAQGYLSRCLQALYPKIEILPDLLGVCTQIDNVLAGQQAEIEKLRAALKDMAKHIWRGDWGKLDPETRALMGEKE